jgi:TRAP-type C4-dicarboxylate transport system permease small subunit
MWRWFVDLPATLLHKIAALILLPAITAVVSTDVFARYFFKAPLPWAQDVCTLTLLMLFTASIPIATARDTHIRIETFYEKFSPRGRAFIDFLSCLSGTTFAFFLAYWEFREIPGMYRRGESAQMLNFPHWPVALFVGISIALVAVILVAQAIRALHDIAYPRTAE